MNNGNNWAEAQHTPTPMARQGPSEPPKEVLVPVSPAPMATAASWPRMPITITSMLALTATFTRRIRTATGVSGTMAAGLPWIQAPLRLRPRPTHKTRKRATRPPALLKISVRLQIRIPMPTAGTAATGASAALAKTHPPSGSLGPSDTMGQLQNDAGSRERGDQLERDRNRGAGSGPARGSGGGGNRRRP